MVKILTDYETKITKTIFTTNAINSEITLLKREAQKIGIETIFDPKQVAEAFAIIGSAGFTAQQAINLTKPTLSISAMSQGVLNLGRSSTLVISLMNKFGYTTKQVGKMSDLLAKSLQNTMFRMEDFPTFFNSLRMAPQLLHLTASESIVLGDSMKKLGALSAQSGASINNFARTMGMAVRGSFNALGNATKGTRRGRLAKQAMVAIFGSEAEMKKAMVDKAGQMRNGFDFLVKLIDKLSKKFKSGSGKEMDLLSHFNSMTKSLILGLKKYKVELSDTAEIKKFGKNILMGTEALKYMRDKLNKNKGTTESFLTIIKGTYKYLQDMWRGTKQVFMIMLARGVMPLLKAVTKVITFLTNIFITISNKFPIVGAFAGVLFTVTTAVLGLVAVLGVLALLFMSSGTALVGFYKRMDWATLRMHSYSKATEEATLATTGLSTAQATVGKVGRLPVKAGGSNVMATTMLAPKSVFSRIWIFIKNLFKKIPGLITKLGRLFKSLGRGLLKFAKGPGPIVVAVIGIIVSAFQIWKDDMLGIKTHIKNFISFLYNTFIKPLKKAFLFIKVLVLALFSDKINVKDANALGLGAVLTIIDLLNTKFFKTIRKAIVLWRTFKDWLFKHGNIIKMIKQELAFGTLGASIGFLAGGPIGSAIGAAIGLAIPWLKKGWEWIKKWYDGLDDISKNRLKTIWKWIKQIGIGSMKFIIAPLMIILDTLYNIGGAILTLFGDTFTDLTKLLEGKIGAGQFFINLGKNIAGLILGIIDGAVTGVIDGIMWMVNGISTAIFGKDAFKNVDDFIKYMDDKLYSLADSIKSLFTNISQWIKGIFYSVMGYITSMMGKLLVKASSIPGFGKYKSIGKDFINGGIVGSTIGALNRKNAKELGVSKKQAEIFRNSDYSLKENSSGKTELTINADLSGTDLNEKQIQVIFENILDRLNLHNKVDIVKVKDAMGDYVFGGSGSKKPIMGSSGSF